jgi:hypothetical protein
MKIALKSVLFQLDNENGHAEPRPLIRLPAPSPRIAGRRPMSPAISPIIDVAG